MGMDKRDFMKVSGLAFLGLGTKVGGNMSAGDHGHDTELNPKRYAMIIDTTKCKEDCTECIDACHLFHNVPDIEGTKHEIKWIWKAPYEHVFAIEKKEYALIPDYLKGKPFITLCNHCDEPPCVRVCPTQATFKRESDGIVMMDYHRCIGCRFCMAGCPYGSRSFNYVDPQEHLDLDNLQNHFPTRTKGVVEKCNFCTERLANNQKPKCVEVCQENGGKALIFGTLDSPEVRNIIKNKHTIRRKPELGTMPMVYYIV